jgi:hypothetical protein
MVSPVVSLFHIDRQMGTLWIACHNIETLHPYHQF